MDKRRSEGIISSPENVELTKTQLKRLASLTKLNPQQIGEGTVAQISERLKWIVDPQIFWFEQICGHVVKTDPVTGIDYPVPYATVHIQDTDCDFLGLFPFQSPWAWLFPYFCRSEELAVVQTDACGGFCAWIPRFEIDWILEWRRQWYCYSEMFVKPTVADILHYYELLPEQLVPFNPHGPDPAPFILKDQGKTVQLLEQVLGKGITHQLVTAEHLFAAGNQRTQLRTLLSQPVFTKPVPPPLPHKIRELHQKGGVQAIAEHFNVEAARMPDLNLKSYVTVPRWRCVEVDYPEWQMIIDSPDITFYVTQNINGVDQTIYSDSYFDIGWESGSPGDVILHASSNALALTTSCVGPVINPNGQPGIQYVGLVPATDEYIAQATGYARRTNRPIPDADASSPFFSTLWLYGLSNYPGTAFYRIKYPAGGGTFTPVRDTLTLLHTDSTTQSIIPDADGWYPVHSDAGLEGPYTSLLVQWQTSGNATYDLQLELADATKTVITLPTPINPLRIAVDDTAPLIQPISLYSYLDGDTAHKENLGFICPLVRRSPGQDVYLEFTFQVTAAHLYDVQLTSGGCGAGGVTLLSVNPNNMNISGSSAEHHYSSDGDDNITTTATFLIPHADAEGSYTMYITAYSRAFSPSDPNGPIAATPWQTTSLWVRSDFYLPVSIVNS